VPALCRVNGTGETGYRQFRRPVNRANRFLFRSIPARDVRAVWLDRRRVNYVPGARHGRQASESLEVSRLWLLVRAGLVENQVSAAIRQFLALIGLLLVVVV